MPAAHYYTLLRTLHKPELYPFAQLIGDVKGEFDLVVAFFMLNHALDRAGLLAMCRGIAAACSKASYLRVKMYSSAFRTKTTCGSPSAASSKR